jgi:aspartate aminotransferase
MPKISQRGFNAPDSPYRKLAPYAEKAKAAGKHIFHLNIGQPDIPSPPAALAAVQLHDHPIIEYGPAQGIQELREVYAMYYERFEVDIDAEDVFATIGASEGIVFAMAASCDAGDEIIIPEPFYASYNSFANFCDAKVVPIPSYLEDGFPLPPIEAFKARISEKTKAIILCNPGNPTGKVYPHEDLEAIVDLCIEKDLFLIVDEVYKEFCYDRPFYSALRFERASEHVIVIDSVSKVFSLCGARIGFITTQNTEVQQAVLRFCKMRLCPSYHGQLLALAAYQNLHPYIDEVKAEYLERRNTLYEALSQVEGVTIYQPEGAFYIITGLPVEDAEHFCQWMLDEFDYQNQTVMFAPAGGFYADKKLGRNQVRIAFVLNSKDIRQAVRCLDEGLQVYNRVAVLANGQVKL